MPWLVIGLLYDGVAKRLAGRARCMDPRRSTLAWCAVLAALALALCGCGNIRAITAQTIDCPDDRLWVSEEVGFGPGEHTWVAKCRHEIYDCKAADSLVTCRPRSGRGDSRTMVIEAPPPPPPPPPM
jgi:hypothetical protein